MAKPSVTSSNFSLIPDEPLTVDKDVMFGHEQVAETLFKIIKNAKPYFTIGLYGGWGTGKSTIVNLLFNRLNKEKVPYVNFDVWKYEKDSLRRQFLIECAEQLLNDPEKVKELRKKFTYTLESKEEGKIKLNRKNLKLKIITFAITAFIASLILVLTHPGLKIDWLVMSVTTLILTALLTSLMVLYEVLEGKFFDKVLVVDELSLTKDKLSQPEEFQKEFQDILDKVKVDKVVFVLDNLDRASHDKSVELLTTVKTFLEEKRCIFLIPCDEEAIKRQVASTYLSAQTETEFNKSNIYADEFLRKFFNSIVRIPKSENLELDTYTTQLLKSTHIPELQKNQDLEWIITNSYRSNPREIKQFINSFVGLVILIKEKMEKGDIYDKNVLKNNTAFLAKMLIFKQKYPATFIKFEDEVLNRGFTWEDMEKLDSNMEDIDKELNDFQGTFDDKKASEFIRDTKSIVPVGVELAFFITLNQSEDEKQVPGWSQFLKAAFGKEIEPAREFINTFEKNKSVESFDAVAANYIKRNMSKITRVQPLASTYIKIVQNNPNFKTPKFDKEIGIQLPSLVTQSYEDFPIGQTFTFIRKNPSATLIRDVAKTYVEILNKIPSSVTPTSLHISNEILTFISKDLSLFNSHISKIKEILLTDFYNKKEYLDLLANSPEKDNLLGEPLSKYIEKFKNTVAPFEEADFTVLLDDLNWLSSKDLLGQSHFPNIVEILRILFEKEVSKDPPDINRRKVLVDITQNYLSQYLNKSWDLKVLGVENNLDYIKDIIEEWYGYNANPDYRGAIFELGYTLWQHSNDDRRTRLENTIIKPYLSNANYSQGYSRFTEERIKDIISNFPTEFIQAGQVDIETYVRGREYLPDDNKDDYYKEISQKSIDNTLQMLIQDPYIPTNTSEILNRYYSEVSGFSNEAKEKLVKVSLKSKCGDSTDIKNNLYQLLKDLNQTDEGKQVVKNNYASIGTLLDRNQKKDIKWW